MCFNRFKINYFLKELFKDQRTIFKNLILDSTVKKAFLFCDRGRSFEHRDPCVPKRSIVFNVRNRPFNFINVLLRLKKVLKRHNKQ